MGIWRGKIGSLKIDQRPCVSSGLIGFSPCVIGGKEQLLQLFDKEGEKKENERERERTGRLS